MNVYVQYLRAIAAILVVLHHTTQRISQVYGYSPLETFASGDSMAYVGVNLFYCLSGYLMASLAATTPIDKFIWHRLARIYPGFFMAIGIAFALCIAFANGIPDFNWWSLTLLPLQIHGLLQVEWTLNYEVAFYAMTALFCFPSVRKFHLLFLIVWMWAILIAHFAFNSFGNPQFPAFYKLPFSMWCLSFVLGGIAYHIMQSDRARAAAIKLGPYAIAVVVYYSVVDLSLAFGRPIVVAVALSAIVACAFAIEGGRKIAPLAVLGNASYGIYLIHQVVGAFAMALIAPGVQNPLVMWAILIGLALTAGIALGLADVATYKRLRRWGDKRLAGPSAKVVRPSMERAEERASV